MIEHYDNFYFGFKAGATVVGLFLFLVWLWFESRKDQK